MPFIAFLFAVFLFIYVELSLLVWVGSHLGILMLILLLIGSSLLGITLMRVRGWYSLTRIKQQLTQGQLPTDALFWLATLACCRHLCLSFPVLSPTFSPVYC